MPWSCGPPYGASSARRSTTFSSTSRRSPSTTWAAWASRGTAGSSAVLVIIRRHQLPGGVVAGAVAVPLTVAYAIGRLGCLLSGDGTYGRPTDLPWGMAFPDGVVPTDVPVHPTPLYEAAAAVLIVAVLAALGRRWVPARVFGAYLVLSGLARLSVELVRINDPVLAGLTQPQLWALVSVAVGGVLVLGARRLQPPGGQPQDNVVPPTA